MTFTEAALEVLRSAGEALHYKKITELAIAGNLLSHVGKTPEVTMSARLATLVKKDRGQSPIVKVRPGVFALRESTMPTDKDSTIEAMPSEPTENAEPKPEAVAAPERPPLPGADVFPEEADDDFPILAGLEEEQSEDRGRRRRRRRRRGGKGGIETNGDEAAPAPERSNNGGRSEHQAREPQRHEPPRNDRDANRREPRRHDAETTRFNRRDREPQQAAPQQALDFNRQPAEGDLLGRDLADAAYVVLSRSERGPATFVRIADLLVRRGRLSGSPEALAPTVAAALRADAARARRAQARQRFRIAGQRVSLTEWLLPRDAVRSQESVDQSAEQQRDQVRRAYVGRLNDLPVTGFAEIIATWLNAEGVTALRAVRRPGSSAREFHFAGTLRRGTEENRLAFVVLRTGRDIDRETVIDVRGSLHNYGGASGAWLVTTGRINGTAREEASAEGAAPCALFAGVNLARAMEALGIGLRLHHVALSDIDFDLLESLGDSQAQNRQDRDDSRPRDRDRDRDPRDRDRDRDRDRGRDRDKDRDRDRDLDRAREADGAGRMESSSEAETDEGRSRSHDGNNEKSLAHGLDLLDPEAAEASRLVPEAQTWAGDEDDETRFEARPTVRVTPPISVGASSDEAADEEIDAADDEEVNADNGDDEQHGSEAGEHDHDHEDDEDSSAEN